MSWFFGKFNKRDLYPWFLGLGVVVYIIFYVWHLRFFALPVISVFAGAVLRLLFKDRFITVFTFLVPVLSPLAWFDNRGLPYNYLIISLVVLLGSFIVDYVKDFRGTMDSLKILDRGYIWFLSFIVLSAFFIFLKWSNITLESIAFFQDTQIEPGGNRNSFGSVFPVVYLLLFTFSPLYYIYGKLYGNIKPLIFAFLGGQTLSIVYALFQKYGGAKPFFWNQYNGLASDASGFGFLCVLGLLLSVYLLGSRISGLPAILFTGISMLGIFTSKTRIGAIGIGLCLLLVFLKLNTKGKVWFLIVLILISSLGGYLILYKNVGEGNLLVGRLKSNIDSLKRIVFSKGEAYGALMDISGYRHQLWMYSWESVKKFPFAGVGAGNFVFWVMGEHFGKDFKHDLPSNQYLFFASSIGLAGLAGFLLFVWFYPKRRDLISYWLMGSIFVIMVVNNFVWLPEGIIGFWIILIVCGDGGFRGSEKRGGENYLFLSLLILGFAGNLLGFRELHPSTIVTNKGVQYNYGLWKGEVNGEYEPFHWTKGEAGIFIELGKNGRSTPVKIFCGAPLGHLKGKRQEVVIYWKGEEYKRFIFKDNRHEVFVIEGEPQIKGFLELRVAPSFNLKEMKLSPEARTLGVQLYYPSK